MLAQHEGQITFLNISACAPLSPFPAAQMYLRMHVWIWDIFDPKAKINLFSGCSGATKFNYFSFAVAERATCVCLAGGISHNEVWIYLIRKTVWVSELPQGTNMLSHRLPLSERPFGYLFTFGFITLTSSCTCGEPWLQNTAALFKLAEKFAG